MRWTCAKNLGFKVPASRCQLFRFLSSLAPEQAKISVVNDTRTFMDFLKPAVAISTEQCKPEHIPYVPTESTAGQGRKVCFETYGCAMNVNDTEIARAVLKNSGYTETLNCNEADVVLLMTCAIREGAEDKIWRRIEQLKLKKIVRNKKARSVKMKIGILGCMAERLKQKIIEKEPAIDLIAGPDSYRHLPNLLVTTEGGQTAVNVALSLDETYADITPVRIDENAVTALVSIMRGCDNMCTYCIVPFTRGRERSRPIDSILDEVRKLSDQGVKQVTLLGQNVNSYRDLSQSAHFNTFASSNSEAAENVAGFSTVYKPKVGGRRFADLLDKVSLIDPDMRIRFTSPHPKDFPDPVLELIKDRPNICNSLHLPAQSGNNAVLESMGRGYTREAYLELVDNVRKIIPDVSISSDFIAGFCGETEEAHQESLNLIRQVGYSICYTYPYSMREKTRAHRRLNDDVPTDVKSRRAVELNRTFREAATATHRQYIGSCQLVLVEADSKRSSEFWMGRTDHFVKTHFPKKPLPYVSMSGTGEHRVPNVGEYVVVQIENATSESMQAKPLYRTNLVDYEKLNSACNDLCDDFVPFAE